MKLNLALIFISASLLVGCGDSTPKCNSDDAKDLVTDISQKQINKHFGQLKDSQLAFTIPKNLDTLVLKVSNIRTLKHDSSLDNYQCAANLEITLMNEQSKLLDTTTIPITYNIQKTDDNNGQFYINVFGL